MKKLSAFLAVSTLIFLANPMSNALAQPPRKPAATLQELLPKRAPNKICRSSVKGAWATAYLHYPKVGYLTLGYYFQQRLVIVAQVDIAQDQPLFIDFNQQDEPLIKALYKLGDETGFSKECEDFGTQTFEVKK